MLWIKLFGKIQFLNRMQYFRSIGLIWNGSLERILVYAATAQAKLFLMWHASTLLSPPIFFNRVSFLGVRCNWIPISMKCAVNKQKFTTPCRQNFRAEFHGIFIASFFSIKSCVDFRYLFLYFVFTSLVC